MLAEVLYTEHQERGRGECFEVGSINTNYPLPKIIYSKTRSLHSFLESVLCTKLLVAIVSIDYRL